VSWRRALKDSTDIPYRVFVLAGSYRYGDGAFNSIGARLEYFRGDTGSDGARTNELQVRLTWGGM
jgi:hypothetical protein